MRTVYLGTSEFAAVVLRRLAESAHRPLLVVTPPDRPKGRGRRTQSPPAAEAARELGIELLQAADVNEEAALERIRAVRPRRSRSAPSARSIREPLLSELADAQRAPLAAAALARRRADRAHDHGWRRAHRGLRDAGDRGARLRPGRPLRGDRRSAPRKTSRRSRRSSPRSAASCWSGLSTCWRRGGSSSPSRTKKRLPMRRRSTPAERRLDPSRPAAELARGRPRPHSARRRLSRDRRRRAARGSPRPAGRRRASRRARCGAEWGALLLGCGQGALRLEVVQPAGGRPMAADAYLRGHPLPKL